MKIALRICTVTILFLTLFATPETYANNNMATHKAMVTVGETAGKAFLVYVGHNAGIPVAAIFIAKDVYEAKAACNKYYFDGNSQVSCTVKKVIADNVSDARQFKQSAAYLMQQEVAPRVYDAAEYVEHTLIPHLEEQCRLHCDDIKEKAIETAEKTADAIGEGASWLLNKWNN